MNHIVLVQILLKVCRLADRKARKHLSGITALAVIGRQHICSK